MKIFFRCTAISIYSLLLLSACGAYRNRILFSTDQEIIKEEVQLAVAEADKNYVIQANDFLELEVYTNSGEMLIDPNREIAREVGMGSQNNQMRQIPQYLVQSNGAVELPMIGEVKISGYTLKEATDLLQNRYEEFYEDTYVLLRYVNKRAIVLGSVGGQVIPLTNENMNLIEILALAGGINTGARTDNIRLIRGNLDDPEVRLIDLSTVEGMKQASLKVLPGDIVYVQPVQRITSEVVRDISPIFSLITTTITLVLLISQLSQ